METTGGKKSSPSSQKQISQSRLCAHEPIFSNRGNGFLFFLAGKYGIINQRKKGRAEKYTVAEISSILTKSKLKRVRVTEVFVGLK
ncbi:hypothetical protein CEE34_09520 [Candidatus Aerophobetes bacterium Ae_b3a]|nr:MAG: hypothetical protein CEE34_09520 [Candidatus Aerophobetes bacterium Ae_b3a]